MLFQAPEVIPALLLHLGRLEWLILGVGDLELLREQTVMFVTQKQEGAVETGLAARTVTQRGPGLQGDLRPVLRQRPQVPGRAGRRGAGRGGSSAGFPRPPPEGSQGACRRPAGPRVSLAPRGRPPFRGPVCERRAVRSARWEGPRGRVGRPWSGGWVRGAVARGVGTSLGAAGRAQGPSRVPSRRARCPPGLESGAGLERLGAPPGPGPRSAWCSASGP